MMSRLLIVLVLLNVASCRPIQQWVFGFRIITEFEPEKSVTFMQKMGIDQPLIYVDADLYNQYQKEQQYNWLAMDRSMQPMQMRMYNQQGDLVGYTVNCVTGMDQNRKLDWFKDYHTGCVLDSFGQEAYVGFTPPPTLQEEVRYWVAEEPIVIDSSKQHVVVYYSRVVVKQNIHLVEEVKRRFGHCEDVNIIYVSLEEVIAKWFSDTLEYYPPVEDDKL